ncbi:MAG: helix-turn-helix transcriptional regulator [Rhizobiaceae bacterium]|nr:helix-turn-helix transcriptional regulator [Rhizobiaceae bacterium]MCV0407054.1 helix-turn-helix transcriptional regulator [Rhizobiaceae bacterium]
MGQRWILSRSLKRAEHDHRSRVEWLERATGVVVGLADRYPAGHKVAAHRHGRAQLLNVTTGVVLVRTQMGRWIVPSGHAMWIPAGVEHAVDMLGDVHMQSVYVLPRALQGAPASLRVLAPSDLMRSLVAEVAPGIDEPPTRRARLLIQLLICEIPRLREVPLSLPLPSDARLVAMCRRFLDDPSRGATIDQWAERAGMSRRTFTRAFQRETGLSLSTWRRQACLLAALPRLADGEHVTTVAVDLGYDSAAAFTTMFRKMLGKPPRDYVRGANPASGSDLGPLDATESRAA